MEPREAPCTKSEERAPKLEEDSSFRAKVGRQPEDADERDHAGVKNCLQLDLLMSGRPA